ncbi:MAG: hypothetical protein MJ183_05860 [Treponemataceae bacterium]|nr:hypothetical protein [Treponemataceae bacterium]
MKSNYEAVSKKAGFTAGVIIGFALLLPLILAAILTISDIGKEYARISFGSNYVMSFVFTLPLSIGMLWICPSVYQWIVEKGMKNPENPKPVRRRRAA